MAVKNILKYLRRTKDVLFIYGDEDLVVSGYTNASFQHGSDNSKYQSGYVFILNGGAISWKSFKQKTTTDSTIESKYITAFEAAKEDV